jgi:hypothetical protein
VRARLRPQLSYNNEVRRRRESYSSAPMAESSALCVADDQLAGHSVECKDGLKPGS